MQIVNCIKYGGYLQVQVNNFLSLFKHSFTKRNIDHLTFFHKYTWYMRSFLTRDGEFDLIRWLPWQSLKRDNNVNTIIPLDTKLSVLLTADEEMKMLKQWLLRKEALQDERDGGWGGGSVIPSEIKMCCTEMMSFFACVALFDLDQNLDQPP